MLSLCLRLFYFKNIYRWMYFRSQEYCTNQFLTDTLIPGTSVVTGVKKSHLLRQNPNVLSCHVVASVICQLLWCELLELERTLIFFSCDGISCAFIVSVRCLLHCQQLLVMAVSASFSRKCFYPIDDFAF